MAKLDANVKIVESGYLLSSFMKGSGPVPIVVFYTSRTLKSEFVDSLGKYLC